MLTGVSGKVWAELSINPLNVTVIFCAFATPVNSTVIVLPLKAGSSGNAANAARYVCRTTHHGIIKGNHDGVITTAVPAFYAGLAREGQADVEVACASMRFPRNRRQKLQRDASIRGRALGSQR